MLASSTVTNVIVFLKPVESKLSSTGIETITKKITKELTVVIDFHGIFFYTMEVNGYHQLFAYQHYSIYLILCSTGEKLQVWNLLMMAIFIWVN